MLFLILISTLLVLFGIIFLSKKINPRGLRINILISYFFILFLSWMNFYQVVVLESSFELNQWQWIELGSRFINMGLTNDNLSAIMVTVVISISSLVHIYSLEYMKSDPHINRFMAYLSLFTLLMLVLVSSQNIVMLFIGWEGVGVCSFLLIGFWYKRIEASKSAIKAILVNRVGDLGLIMGLIMMWELYGTLNFTELNSCSTISSDSCYVIFIFVILAVAGKSAQFGLHSWLPDAMEGPTPVSALIHAATMVTAGVYLIIRMSVLITQNSISLVIIVFLGSLTAFFAASAGLFQNDFKKIIAYSTCSQLGYMVLVCGISQFSLSLFHLFNHAFFKALLFLSAGSIIHSISNEQDIRKSGNLLNSSPITSLMIIVGSMSLMGLPFLSGFYSKEVIIELSNSESLFFYGFIVSSIGAFLTSVYSLRLIFWGVLKEEKGSLLSKKLSFESPLAITVVLVILGGLSIISGYFFLFIKIEVIPTISSNTKLLPLIFSIIGLITVTTTIIFINYSNNCKTVISSFLINSWGLDLVLNKIISKLFLNISDFFYFKIDRGVLEKVGPYGVFYKINEVIRNIHYRLKSQYLNYFPIFALFIVVYLLIN